MERSWSNARPLTPRRWPPGLLARGSTVQRLAISSLRWSSAHTIANPLALLLGHLVCSSSLFCRGPGTHDLWEDAGDCRTEGNGATCDSVPSITWSSFSLMSKRATRTPFVGRVETRRCYVSKLACPHRLTGSQPPRCLPAPVCRRHERRRGPR